MILSQLANFNIHANPEGVMILKKSLPEYIHNTYHTICYARIKRTDNMLTLFMQWKIVLEPLQKEGLPVATVHLKNSPSKDKTVGTISQLQIPYSNLWFSLTYLLVKS